MGFFPRLQGRWAFCPGSLVGGEAGPPVVLRMATWWQPQPTLLSSQPAPNPSGFFQGTSGSPAFLKPPARGSPLCWRWGPRAHRGTQGISIVAWCVRVAQVRVQRPWEWGTSPPGVHRSGKRLGIYLETTVGKGPQWAFTSFWLSSTH